MKRLTLKKNKKGGQPFYGRPPFKDGWQSID